MLTVSTRRRLTWRDFRAIALFAAGLVAISGHVGTGLSILGPLTLLPTIALGLAAVCSLLLLPSGNGGGQGLLGVVVALIVTAPAWLLAGDHEYATDKVSALLTIVVPLLIVVAFCSRRVEDMEWFLHGVFVLGALGVIVALLDLRAGVDIGMRGSDNTGYLNPIAAGRLAGSVLLWLLFGPTGYVPRAAKIAFGIACGAVLLGAASRGPLLSLIVAVGCTALAARALRGRLAVVAIGVGLALTAGVGNAVLQESGDRILEGGDIGGTSSRTYLWSQAVEAIQVWPEGIGWGQFGAPGLVGANGDYPHNLILEVALEAGVFAGVCLVLLAAITLRKLWSATEVYGPAYLALLVFWLFTAMFSSDVNGNRVAIILLFGLFAGFRTEIADLADTTDELARENDRDGRFPVPEPGVGAGFAAFGTGASDPGVGGVTTPLTEDPVPDTPEIESTEERAPLPSGGSAHD